MKSIFTQSRALFVFLLLFVAIAQAQSPQGMAYQAVVRNASGTPVTSTPVGMRFSILQGSSTGSAVYVETQSATTNGQGVVALTIGAGSPVSGTFAAINWANGPYFLKVEVDPNNQETYPLSNVSQLQSVPYALYAKSSSSSYWSINQSGGIYPSNGGNVGIGTATPNGMLEVKGTDSDPTVPLFEVKDINGNPVFAVYPDGVEVTVDMAAIGRPAKGGFAVSGRNSTRGTTTDIMRVTPDSTTIFINNALGRPAKGGFAVSGRNSTRAGVTSNILTINADSTRIYTADPVAGFGVGQASGSISDNYLRLLPSNYFIGHQSGLNTTGLYNTFFGYTTGFANTSGESNIFIGNASGYNNLSGSNNVFLGNQSGYSNIAGNFNTFLGFQSGYSNNGSFNSFVGYQAGQANTTGTNNTFLGYFAGKANTTGSSNVFFGNQSGVSNTTGASNIFIGENSGFSNVSGFSNIFIGRTAGYSGVALKSNIFIGDSSGYFSNNQFATNNVFIGYAAGKNTQSYNNIFLGNLAGYSNSGGQNNIAIGDKAGYSNTTSQNIFIGTEAGTDNTSGYFNIMLGRYAGHVNTTGYQQILIGGSAGGSLTTGHENVMIGSNAGAVNSTGIGNVFVGTSAGWSNTGSYNVILGYKVGYGAFSTVSNRLIIDGGAVTTPLIWGEFDNRKVAINSTSPGSYTFYVNGTAYATSWSTPSDRRLKKDIVPIPDALSRVMQLQGVNFHWKDKAQGDALQMGFIAQDAEKIIPEVVTYSKDNDSYSLQYAPVTALLVEAIKQQQAIIKKQTESTQAQQSQIDDLKVQVAKLNELVKQLLNSK